jgi:putative transcriptional regulator
MAKMAGKTLEKWEATRELNAELLESIRELKAQKWARKTEFIPQPDGSLRRLITRRDGTVEKDEVVPAKALAAVAASASTGLSQAEFAKLLGLSKRTLQEWEQGRKQPTGAAKSLLKIALKHPNILREMLTT